MSRLTEMDRVPLKTVCYRVDDLAKKKGISMAQIAIAWVLSKEGVTAPIIGTTSLDNLKDILGMLSLAPANLQLLILLALSWCKCQVDRGRDQAA